MEPSEIITNFIREVNELSLGTPPPIPCTMVKEEQRRCFEYLLLTAPKLAEALAEVNQWILSRKDLCERESELYSLIGLEKQIAQILQGEK